MATATLFTIGFTGKSAETFFELLRGNGVTRVIDTRLHNAGQLAGFAKREDLRFFLKKIGGIGYEHRLDLAASKELYDAYRDKELSWDSYAEQYLDLIRRRGVEKSFTLKDLDGACLLCSEHSPEQCHRSVLAGYLRSAFPELTIQHLR